ncbi:hypothetical protein J4461_02420 [Candidatus Pacearchaeota archaeon]|nr:hypothetical protein [Candidatus Pacearchaeota archaeon]
METEETKMKHVLENLAKGATCDYQPVRGGVIMILSVSEQKSEGVDISTFLKLRDRGYIDMKPEETKHNYHPIFRPSFQNPIDIYRITDQGKAYLGRKEK